MWDMIFFNNNILICSSGNSVNKFNELRSSIQVHPKYAKLGFNMLLSETEVAIHLRLILAIFISGTYASLSNLLVMASSIHLFTFLFLLTFLDIPNTITKPTQYR